MNRKTSYAAVAGLAGGAALSLVLAFVFFSAGSGSAGSAGEGGGLASSVSQDVDGGPSEGITVHGDWVIDVREPDGRLVSHHEFRNLLLPLGANTLTQLLLGGRIPGKWRVHLTNSNLSLSPCERIDINFPKTDCWTEEGPGTVVPPSDPTLAIPPEYDNLSKISPGGGITLMGHVFASADGEINKVSTSLSFCGGSLNAPFHCDNHLFVPVSGSPAGIIVGRDAFTLKHLASPVVVFRGQRIDVTVRIAFQ